MTIKFEKKAYIAPKMNTIELKANAVLLGGSTGSSDYFDLEEEDAVELGSIGTFGNDKA